MSAFYLIALVAVAAAVIAAFAEAVAALRRPPPWAHTPAARLQTVSTVDRRQQQLPFVGHDRRQSAVPARHHDDRAAVAVNA